jgi:hypothetical protein
MKSRQGYKGYVIVARSCELREGEFSAEFSVEEHEADGFMETEFYLPDTFPTQESAIEAAIQAGRQKIDAGFERGRAVVNGYSMLTSLKMKLSSAPNLRTSIGRLSMRLPNAGRSQSPNGERPAPIPII